MTDAQLATVVGIVQDMRPVELHHGDCVGSDAQMHELVRYHMPTKCRIVVHPPSDPRARAFRHGDEVRGMKPYLDRNRDIALACDLLIACPAEFQEVRRSGTWATVRYARGMDKPLVIVYPDGNVQWTSSGKLK